MSSRAPSLPRTSGRVLSSMDPISSPTRSWSRSAPPAVPGHGSPKVRRLDTLFAEGTLPRADVIKLDCEGFEPEILAGAREFMRASKVLAVTAETNFLPSKAGARTQFDDLHAILLEQGLRVFDLVSERLPRPEYLRLRQERAPHLARPLRSARQAAALRYGAARGVRFPVLQRPRRREERGSNRRAGRLSTMPRSIASSR